MSNAVIHHPLPLLIGPDEVAGLLHTGADVVIFDATYYLPHHDKQAGEAFQKAHLPGARFFDIDEIADQETDLPHMLPDAQTFTEHLRRLGLNDGQWVVVYDQHGLFSAPRAWWMLRAMGVETVSVMQGGLPAWQAKGLPVEVGPGDLPNAMGTVTACFQPEWVAQFEDVKRVSSGERAATILDARSAPRFAGLQPEPRPGLRSGHIPGSKNLPFTKLIDDDGYFYPAERLRQTFEDLGVTTDASVLFTCGSGVTACIPALAMASLGASRVTVYDGSWAEWGDPAHDVPVAEGTR